MEQLAPDEFAILAKNQCPNCDGVEFRLGPRGGAAQNIECRRCKGRFNVIRLGGELIFAERIPSEADGGALWIGEGSPRAHEGDRLNPQTVAFNIVVKADEIATEIGRRVGEHGGRPEDWLTDRTRAGVVSYYARQVLIEWLLGRK